MRKLRALWLRLCGFFRHRENEDFSAELEFHVAMHTEDGVRSGLNLEEARRLALIRLGGVEQTRQAYRERRGLPWLESLARDLAYSMRTLSKHRSATVVAVLSIGLGIGANATIFSMVSRFVLASCAGRGSHYLDLAANQARCQYLLRSVFMASVHGCSRWSSLFCWCCCVLSTDSSIDRRERRTRARDGTGCHCEFLRYDRTPHDVGARKTSR